MLYNQAIARNMEYVKEKKLIGFYNLDNVFTARYELGLQIKQTTFGPWSVMDVTHDCNCIIDFEYYLNIETDS
jgi:hypothetical protein